MGSSTDAVTEEVFRDGFSVAVPKDVAHRGRWIMTLLDAAKELRDVEIIGDFYEWDTEAHRLAIHIRGKWFVTFAWEDTRGASAYRIERG